MRIYIIGRVKRVHKVSGKKLGTIEAYMVHDLHSNENKLKSKEQLYEAVKRGYQIIGLSRSGREEIKVKKEVQEQGKTVVRYETVVHYRNAHESSYHSYNTKKVDELNGAGEPITPPEERREILLGNKGFGENKVYVVINSTGEKRELTYNELLDLTKNDRIIGATVKVDKESNEYLTEYEHCSLTIRESNKKEA